jgi:aminopeptidase N
MSGGALGMLEYMKTGTGLQLLREHILGPERFDYAFRTYIRRWAFKSPQPADFFRSMEDAAGADLAWFWRGWFLEPAKLDQAIDEVRENDKGATIVFTNLDRMVMPLNWRITWDDDTVENRKLPVEIWHSSNRVVQMLPPGTQIKNVEIDPEQAFPDSARANNVWPRKEEEKK